MLRTMALDLDPLWASELVDFELDLLRQRADLSFRTRDGDDFHLFRLTCEGITELRYINEIPGPWAQVEATSAEAEDLPNGRVRIRLEFWNDPSGLVIEAVQAALDREQIP
jgi:hypothetical protein